MRRKRGLLRSGHIYVLLTIVVLPCTKDTCFGDCCQETLIWYDKLLVLAVSKLTFLENRRCKVDNCPLRNITVTLRRGLLRSGQIYVLMTILVLPCTKYTCLIGDCCQEKLFRYDNYCFCMFPNRYFLKIRRCVGDKIKSTVPIRLTNFTNSSKILTQHL